MTLNNAYLNGQYLPIDDAKISVLDRGFIFADGVYEVIPVYEGYIFRLEEHLQRLNANLDALYISRPYDLSQWKNILSKLISEDYQEDSSLYIQITRGSAPRELAIDQVNTPTIFVMIRQLSKTDYSDGISAMVAEDIRWKYCNIKTISLLPNVLLRHQAEQLGAIEAILVRDGYVTEGCSSNVFIVQDGIVKTPQNNNYLLSGITRNLVVQLLQQNNFNCQETAIKEEELRQADEIWLTSSTREIIPVTKLDSNTVGSGHPSDFFKQIVAIYQQFKTDMVQRYKSSL